MSEEKNKKPIVKASTDSEPGFFKEMGKYILHDIVMPKLYDIMHGVLTDVADMGGDIIHSSIDSAFNDGRPTRSYRSGSRRRDNERYDYSSSSVTRRDIRERARRANNRDRSSQRIAPYWCHSKDEAADAIDAILDDIAQYGICKVSRYYEIFGAEAMPQDFKYGWTKDDERDIRYELDRGHRNSDGELCEFKITVPRPRDITN